MPPDLNDFEESRGKENKMSKIQTEIMLVGSPKFLSKDEEMSFLNQLGGQSYGFGMSTIRSKIRADNWGTANSYSLFRS